MPLRSSVQNAAAAEEPTQHDHVARDALQAEHAGAVGREVVQVRHDRDFDAPLEQQAGDDVFLQLTLGRIGALPLRDDDGELTSH